MIYDRLLYDRFIYDWLIYDWLIYDWLIYDWLINMWLINRIIIDWLGNEELPILYIHRQSAYLCGRDRKVADIPLDHPSCSKQVEYTFRPSILTKIWKSKPYIRMVYFWTYAHPTYNHVVLTAVVGPMHCRSDGHVKNSIFVHPTYFKLSLGHVLVGLNRLMGLFCRSDGHFS